MSWEFLLKRRIDVDPLIRKPAFRKAIMAAADEVGPQFALIQIHEPFLEIYKKELVEAGLRPVAASQHIKRYSSPKSFGRIAVRYLNFIGKENGVKIYEKVIT